MKANRVFTLEELKGMNRQVVWCQEINRLGIISVATEGKWKGTPFFCIPKNGQMIRYNIPEKGLTVQNMEVKNNEQLELYVGAKVRVNFDTFTAYHDSTGNNTVGFGIEYSPALISFLRDEQNRERVFTVLQIDPWHYLPYVVGIGASTIRFGSNELILVNEDEIGEDSGISALTYPNSVTAYDPEASLGQYLDDLSLAVSSSVSMELRNEVIDKTGYCIEQHLDELAESICELIGISSLGEIGLGAKPLSSYEADYRLGPLSTKGIQKLHGGGVSNVRCTAVIERTANARESHLESTVNTRRCVYFIDTENVGNMWGISPTSGDLVLVFFSKAFPSIAGRNLSLIRKANASVECFECVQGTNALDFQLSTELGYRIAKDPTAEYVIISNDTGYDAVVHFWLDRSIKVKRVSVDLSQIHVKKAEKKKEQKKDAVESKMASKLAEYHSLLETKNIPADYIPDILSAIEATASCPQNERLNAACQFIVKQRGQKKGVSIYKKARPTLKKIFGGTV